MTPLQQKAIIAAVVAGATWPAAALKAGITPEQLADTVKAAQQSGCRLKIKFIHRLKQAGEKATEDSLKYHKGALEHA